MRLSTDDFVRVPLIILKSLRAHSVCTKERNIGLANRNCTTVICAVSNDLVKLFVVKYKLSFH